MGRNRTQQQGETRDLTGDVTYTGQAVWFSPTTRAQVLHQPMRRYRGPGGRFEEMSKSPLRDQSPTNTQFYMIYDQCRDVIRTEGRSRRTSTPPGQIRRR
jgi:hypothetical protein